MPLMGMTVWRKLGLGLALTFLAHGTALAQDSEELAKQIANPIASLISVPFQGNYDCCFGSSNANKYTLNIQPVIPVSLNNDWNMIVRTIVPLISEQETMPGAGGLSGFGDTTQSFFFSPKRPTSDGWIWGAGPVFLWPTATHLDLGSGRWGAGPTAVLLKQESGWTYGALVNHIWSYADHGGGQDVSASFLQPFVSYTTKTAFTVSLNTESTYDWIRHQWTVPINLLFSQIVKIGKQPISIQAGPRYYAEAPPNGPRWGARFNVTLLFPAGQ